MTAGVIVKYSKRVSVQLPKSLLDNFERAVLRDGRRRAEVLRTLIVNYVRENNGAARGAAGGAAGGTTA